MTNAHTPALSESADRSNRLIRIGTWYLVPNPKVKREPEAIVTAIIKSLKDDPRVLNVKAPELDEHWTAFRRRWPDADRTDGESLMSGSDAFRVLRLSDPIVFSVRVPIKNQPQHHGADDVPTDRYAVAWNGCAIFVAWDQKSEHVPLSGGQVIAQVLRDVLAAVDCDLYVESCTPNCKFMFVHTTPLVLVDPTTEHGELRQRPDGRVVVPVKVGGSPSVAAEMAWYSLVGHIESFSSFKNVGRRLVDIENQCRHDLAHLLGHHYEHSSLLAAGRSIKTYKERWTNRGWRMEARALISGLWLSMANLEALRREWEERRFNVESQPMGMLLFKDDFTRDVGAVTQLNVDPIVETVDQVASGLDNRLVVAATAWGALAGGLVGGLAGGVVGLLTS